MACIPGLYVTELEHGGHLAWLGSLSRHSSAVQVQMTDAECQATVAVVYHQTCGIKLIQHISSNC